MAKQRLEVLPVHEVVKVDDPTLQNMDEIAALYWNNWLLISNVTDIPKGGVVRYYCYVRDSSLTSLIMEMDKDFDTYGECIIRFVGPSRGSWLGRMGA